MVKDNEIVIEEFNELVNMSAKDLESWLKSEDSEGAGWSKDDGSGESIGHERCCFEPDMHLDMLTWTPWPQDHRDPEEQSQEGPEQVR